jgi:hypothetical protein
MSRRSRSLNLLEPQEPLQACSGNFNFTVYIYRPVHIIYTSHIHYIHKEYTLYTYYIHITYILCTYYILMTYTLYTCCTHMTYTLHTHYTHTTYTLYTHYTHITYTLHTHYYPITGLDRPLGFQAIETPRISRQSAYEDGKVVSSRLRLSLPPGEYMWYPFLLETESTPGP